VERTLLNFLGHLCGIASKTNAFVKKIRPYSTRILDTRKTTPLWRDLEKQAVLAGGGKNHRMGLYDAIFVKENHRPYGQLGQLRKFPHRFEIEVRDLREMVEALILRPAVILFDNFTPADLKKAVKLARKANPKIILEASGGVTLENVKNFAATGVDQISVGSLTHSVKAIDLSLLVRTAY
jgi:nicotinate-nucleotide pyrophosphorylase (carboxylating)